jgi:6-phosphofructokinase 1
MKVRIQNIGIITPGGDAPGMNACIRAIVRNGIFYGHKVYGIMYGYKGLIEDEVIALNLRSVSGIIYRGGTILKSSRCEEIKTPSGMKKALEVLKKRNIDYLIIIGGDGSLQGCYRLLKYGHRMAANFSTKMIFIPASIDNDIYGTEETIGFDTAIDTALSAIDNIRDTASSFDRVFIIEVMGREHGFLAVDVGLAAGAEFVLIPEMPYSIEKICRQLKDGRASGKTSEIIIFAEGCGEPYVLAKEIQRRTGLETRVSRLGYIQRGGSPTARSRILATLFGTHSVDLVNKGIGNRAVVLQNGKVRDIDLSVAVRGRKKINRNTYDLVSRLAI